MILDFSDILSIDCLTSYKNQMDRLTFGITSGCWDLTHYYHLRFWERCKRHCDVLIVGVDDDYLVRQTKGQSRPIFNEGHRLRLVDHSKYVQAAFLMHKVTDLERMCQYIKPDFMFKNQAFKDMSTEQILGSKYVDEVVIINDVEEKTSTSEFVKLIERS